MKKQTPNDPNDSRAKQPQRATVPSDGKLTMENGVDRLFNGWVQADTTSATRRDATNVLSLL